MVSALKEFRGTPRLTQAVFLPYLHHPDTWPNNTAKNFTLAQSTVLSLGRSPPSGQAHDSGGRETSLTTYTTGARRISHLGTDPPMDCLMWCPCAGTVPHPPWGSAGQLWVQDPQCPQLPSRRRQGKPDCLGWCGKVEAPALPSMQGPTPSWSGSRAR